MAEPPGRHRAPSAAVCGHVPTVLTVAVGGRPEVEADCCPSQPQATAAQLHPVVVAVAAPADIVVHAVAPAVLSHPAVGFL